MARAIAGKTSPTTTMGHRSHDVSALPSEAPKRSWESANGYARSLSLLVPLSPMTTRPYLTSSEWEIWSTVGCPRAEDKNRPPTRKTWALSAPALRRASKAPYVGGVG
uniref:Uncharacterized protein n=1 Tax=Trichuris muris TaxID=70415 RepID=A0A5S6QSQ2_TRIMR